MYHKPIETESEPSNRFGANREFREAAMGSRNRDSAVFNKTFSENGLLIVLVSDFGNLTCARSRSQNAIVFCDMYLQRPISGRTA